MISLNLLLIIKNIKKIAKIFPVKKIQVFNDEIVIFIENLMLLDFLTFLKYHLLCQYNVLVSISSVDYIKKKKRFELVYDLLSIRYNNRIRIKISVNQLQIVESCEKLYFSAGWFENEIFDMFGIFFFNHNNLRRILTDYGFEGHPLRKDFPLTGFVEPHYDDLQQKVVYGPVNLPQEYRNFDTLSPWAGMTQARPVLPGDEKATVHES